MVKRVFIVLFILAAGLLANLYLFNHPIVNVNPTNPDYGLCTGHLLDPLSGKFGTSAGYPIHKTWVRNLSTYSSCSPLNPITNREILDSWQFYVDWIIWIIPWFVIVIIIRKTHAHYRH